MTIRRLKPDKQRTALRILGRDRLSELTDFFEFDVDDRRVIDNHVDAIVRSRTIDFADVLAQLYRDELKSICEALEIDSGGRSKQRIIDRILGNAPCPAPPRVDFVFSLLSGRPMMWFEVGNHPDRAAHRRLKMFGDVLSLIPAFSVGILHGPTAKATCISCLYLEAGLVLPRRFFGTVNVPANSYDANVTKMDRWKERVCG